MQHICQCYPTKVIYCRIQYRVYITVKIHFLSAPCSPALGDATRQAAGLCSSSLRDQQSCRSDSCLPRAWGVSRLTAGPNAETRSDHLSGLSSQSITADRTFSLCFSLSWTGITVTAFYLSMLVTMIPKKLWKHNSSLWQLRFGHHHSCW